MTRSTQFPSRSRSRSPVRRGAVLIMWWWIGWAAAGTGAGAEVWPGIDVLAAGGFAELRGKRVGLISNPSAVNRRGEKTWRVLRNSGAVKLVSLFGAEHGFDGRARAGSEVRDGTEPESGLPVHSLYGPGPVRRPTTNMLRGLDVLVYDIQDTGCRSYTFISTLGLAMEACAEAGVAFCVLDRPNPLGGLRVEGPERAPRFKSFVGQWPTPYVYGLTPGELAGMINGEGWISRKCRLSVVRLKNWNRAMTWKDTGLRWVATSPNVPSGETPLYLVATGVLGEIGGLNLATGSADSFRIVGAPWIEPGKFVRTLQSARIPGLEFSAVELDFNRRSGDGKELRGARLTFTDPARAPLVAVNYHLLEAVKRSAGRDLFADAASRGRSWDMFDKVSGTDQVRVALQRGKSAREIIAAWGPGEERFRKLRIPYLLYPTTHATTNPTPKSRPPRKTGTRPG